MTLKFFFRTTDRIRRLLRGFFSGARQFRRQPIDRFTTAGPAPGGFHPAADRRGAGRLAMRRWLLLAVAGLMLGNTGCLINAYSSDPNRRMNELLNNSEDLRQIEYEWERIWFNDQPSHMTPERVNGGIQ
jgi:hypothetical protein